MITAIVLVTCDAARIPEVAQDIAALDGVTEVYSVTGDADLVAWRDRLGAHQVVRPGDELGAAVDGIRDFTLTDPCGNRLTFREAT